MTNSNSNKAGVLALVLSFLIPLAGIICFFVKKNDVENPKAYLWAALAGFITGIVLNVALGGLVAAMTPS